MILKLLKLILFYDSVILFYDSKLANSNLLVYLYVFDENILFCVHRISIYCPFLAQHKSVTGIVV